MLGGERLREALDEKLGRDVRVVRAPCMGGCERAAVAEVGHHAVDQATAESVAAAVRDGHAHAEAPPYEDLAAYRAGGGYRLLAEVSAGRRTADELIQILETSGLRGLGGAGFPSGRKWRFVRQEPAPRLMAVNADEGEPGTFKDRFYLERDPHRFIEGMLIAAWVVEAAEIYLYIRDEYPEVRLMLADELAKVEAAGLARGVTVH